MRKITLTVLIMLLATVAFAYDHTAQAPSGQTLYFTFTSSTTAKVVAGEVKPTGRLTIPASVEGRAVVEIDRFAFSDCPQLTSVSIPGSVLTVGVRAFTNCTALTSAYLAEGVRTLSMGAFNSCTRLDTIEVPSTLTKIGSGAVGNTAFESTHGRPLVMGHYLVYVPEETEGTFVVSDTIVGIADFAAYYCNITKVSLPANLRFIGDNAFADCLSLDTICSSSLVPPAIESYSFRNNAATLVCIVPCAALAAYRAAPYWSGLNLEADTCPNPPEGIANADGELPSVSVAHGGLLINASAGQSVMVSDMMGRKVASAIISSSPYLMSLPTSLASGVYMVLIGDTTPKKFYYLK